MNFVADGSARSRVLVSGPEGPAFLHRLSTQHVTDLKVGEARLSALTTDKGRIKDLVHHVVLDEGILLIGHQLPGQDLVAWLDRYFFTEKLALEDVGGRTACVVVDVATADGVVAGAAALGPWQAKRQGDVVAVRSEDRVGSDGSVVAAFVLVSFGPPFGSLPAVTLSADEDRTMAIAAGVPVTEIGEAHTPLDLDLHDAIHWAKGCYIGQEVIARLDTYGKQRKHLVSAVVAADTVVGAAVATVDGANITGVITSVAPVWGAGLPNALALIKGDIAADGTIEVTVGGRPGRPGRLQRRRAAQQPHD